VEKADVLDAILIGFEKTACIISRCAIYESLYLNGARTEAADNLQKSTVQLYTAILSFVAKAIAKSKGALFGEPSVLIVLTFSFRRGSLQSSSRDRGDCRLLQRCQGIGRDGGKGCCSCRSTLYQFESLRSRRRVRRTSTYSQ